MDSVVAQALGPKDRQRLCQILGLLGSAFDGERASAAAMADKMLREHGLTWEHILAETRTPNAPIREPRSSHHRKEPASHRSQTAPLSLGRVPLRIWFGLALVWLFGLTAMVTVTAALFT